MGLTVNQMESLKWLSRIAGADSSIAAAVAELEHLAEENERLQAEVQSDIDHTEEWHRKWETAEAKLKGSEERSRLLLEAKNRWADRARKAEAELKRLEHEVAVLREHLDPDAESLGDVVLRLEEECKRERHLREQIEQRCDPAGDTQELVARRDQVVALEKRVDELLALGGRDE